MTEKLSKVRKYRRQIAGCIEKNFDFTNPDEDDTKALCGFIDDWEKLDRIIRRILRDEP